jgi:hypothetical protein
METTDEQLNKYVRYSKISWTFCPISYLSKLFNFRQKKIKYIKPVTFNDFIYLF